MGKKRKRREPLKVIPPENLAARAAGKVVTYTRKDALARLLSTAVFLWTYDEDPLSIHLLICASYECLDVLGAKVGKRPTIKAKVGEKFTLGYDWLRHGSSNPNVALDFPPRLNAQLLFDVIVAFDRIFGGLTILMRACRAWLATGPELELSEEIRRKGEVLLPEGFRFEEVGNFTRRTFMEKACEMLDKEYGMTGATL